MKKFAFAIAMVATLVVALMSAGFVFAQAPTPAAPQPGTGYGYGRGGGMNGGGMGSGMMGGRAAGVAVGDGILHDGMIAVYAEKLGISVDDLNARLAKGETMATIATEKGLTTAQFTALMQDARSQAIDQAVKAGTLTQEQADWMKTRGGAMNNGGGMSGAGRGGAMNNGGMRGGNMNNGGMRNGTGPAAGTTNCPYFTQTNP